MAALGNQGRCHQAKKGIKNIFAQNMRTGSLRGLELGGSYHD